MVIKGTVEVTFIGTILDHAPILSCDFASIVLLPDDNVTEPDQLVVPVASCQLPLFTRNCTNDILPSGSFAVPATEIFCVVNDCPLSGELILIVGI